MQKIETLEPNILLSVVNMKLRNDYQNLEDMCEDLNLSVNVLTYKLQSIGFIYSQKHNQFLSA